jgi:glycogen synthase kinase 3 beta
MVVMGAPQGQQNGFKEAANLVEFLGKEMLGMQLRAAKTDTDDLYVLIFLFLWQE